MTSPTRPNDETKEAEEAEAQTTAGADRGPTEAEKHDAEKTELDPQVVTHETEMMERGAHQKGEGRI
ncbi:MAG: hypothetical protein ACRD0I_10920 [Acidimicrobiales bacterium]